MTNSNFFEKKYVFIDFTVNLNVLFHNLLKLFFSDKWIHFYSVWKGSIRKSIFSKKNFFLSNFLLVLKWFLIFLYKGHPPKKFFLIFMEIFQKWFMGFYHIPNLSMTARHIQKI